MTQTPRDILIFKTEDGKITVDARFDEETAWLSLDQMAELFDRNKSTISRHIKNIFDEKELQRDSVVAKFATTAVDNKIYQVEEEYLKTISSLSKQAKKESRKKGGKNDK